MSLRRILLVQLGALSLILAGCGDDDDGDCYRATPEIRPPDISAVPETLVAAGVRLVARPYLWRDFMPVSPPGGKPMIAIARAVEVDSLPIPDGAELTHLWVLNGSEYWSTPFSAEAQPQPPPYELREVARCGPKWGPEILVDVIVRIRLPGGVERHIKATQVAIERTD